MSLRPPCVDPALAAEVAKAAPHAQELRRRLHTHPEIMFEEVWTSAQIREELDRLGIAHVDGFAGGTGVVAHLPGGEGETIGLRADIDALPIEEETDVAWRSTIPGRMHACGHDGHTAILLGTAAVLTSMARSKGLPRPVTLVFQPAEEGGGGARLMCEEGALDGSRLGTPVTRMYGLHGWPSLPLGCVSSRPGPILAATDAFEVKVDGVGGHAAIPHLLRNPLLAACEMIAGLPTLVATTTAATDAVVLTPTRLAGGDAFNVIPERVVFGGTLRTLEEATRERVILALENRCRSLGQAHGCTVEVHWREGYPVTANDPECFERCRGVLEESLGADRVLPFGPPVMLGEDFSYYGREVPACFFALGLHPEGNRQTPALHSPHFDFDDHALPFGIAAMTSLAISG